MSSAFSTSRPVRFFHRGACASVAIDGAPAAATRTVLEWLREDAQCTGTKEGCAEGDCGACTVVVGALDDAGALVLQPVNACIQFLPTLDGKALFTVEDVALVNAGDGTLHPAQQALVDCHGSQCGFCTPGFVMSLWSCYQRHQAAGTVPTRQQLADDLSGNLCRCTGYRPILDAGQRMFDAPPATFDTQPAIAALQALRADPPLDGPVFHAPRTLEALATLRADQPQATLLAGSTDIGLWVTKQFRPLGTLLYLGNVADLLRVTSDDRQLTIGAGASLEAAFAALAQDWPTLHEVWLRFASLPIRNAGTMGGNIANGSPIGDSAPVLMALGASVVLRQRARLRTLPLDDFYLDYMKNRLEPGEFIQALQVPRPAPVLAPGEGRQQKLQELRVYKISKRFDSDISAVCAALAIELDDDHITDSRLAFGGMAATVRRATGAEAALRGQRWSETTLQAAMAALALDFQPLSDMRASASYRLQVAQNLLQRFWLETRAEQPLAADQVRVFARAKAA